MEQVASHLRDEITSGELHGSMPGVHKLAADFDIHHVTAEAVVKQLISEGFLVGQGAGRPRKIVLPSEVKRSKLKICIIPYYKNDWNSPYVVGMQNRLREAGFTSKVSPKSLDELEMKVDRVKRMVESTPADAWIVMMASGAILEWFGSQTIPSFAMFGRVHNPVISATGVDKSGAYRKLVRRLVELGHSRIVMLALEERRKPHPGHGEKAFLDELEVCGIKTSQYQLPDWGGELDELPLFLKKLFSVTPPTALVVQMSGLYHAVADHLGQMGIIAPRDISLVCADFSDTFTWCQPTVAHINFSSRVMYNHVVRWAENVAQGVDYRKKIYANAKFIEGGTVGKSPC